MLALHTGKDATCNCFGSKFDQGVGRQHDVMTTMHTIAIVPYQFCENITLAQYPFFSLCVIAWGLCEHMWQDRLIVCSDFCEWRVPAISTWLSLKSDETQKSKLEQFSYNYFTFHLLSFLWLLGVKMVIYTEQVSTNFTFFPPLQCSWGCFHRDTSASRSIGLKFQALRNNTWVKSKANNMFPRFLLFVFF